MRVDDNPILDYWETIKLGLPASAKVKKQVQKLVMDLADAPWQYYFDPVKAERAVMFIERFCRHSSGEWGGRPFVLELWQKAFVCAIFGFVDLEGHRKYREAWLMVARKNGKSALASAVSLYLMIADGEPGAKIYSAATKRDQAKIVWSEATLMVKQSAALRRRIKILVSKMKSDVNNSEYVPLGKDSKNLDGLNAHGAILDEVHAWEDRNLYDVIVDSTSARKQPLILGTTTMGTVREGIFDIKYDEIARNLNGFQDDRLLAFVYELDNRKEWTDPACWKKANPGLGTIKKVDTLERKVAKAKDDALLVNNLLCKDFNIRTNTVSAYFTFDDVNNQELIPADEKPKYAVGGADFSRVVDLTAAVALYKTSPGGRYYVRCMFWIPEDTLEKHVREDKIPYDVWEKKGLVRLCPGNKIDYHMVTAWFQEIQQELGMTFLHIGYDAWSAAYWVDEMAASFGENVLDKVYQGKQTLSLPMQQIKAEFQSKNIVYDNNPIMKWCLTNVEADVDKNGNIQPAKGINPRKRIDGFAALLNAYTEMLRNMEEYNSFC